jgi:hypothetical protein
MKRFRIMENENRSMTNYKTWRNRRGRELTKFSDADGVYYIFSKEWRRYYIKKPKGSYYSLSRKLASKKIRKWLNE